VSGGRLQLVAVLALATLPVLTAGRQSALSSPPMPYEDAGACPFEGCAYGEWRANETVVVRRTRSSRAPVAFTILRNETITAVTGIVITTSPGRVRVRQAVDLQSLSGPLHVDAGETLYLLTYRGEGLTKAWFKGRVYDELDGGVAFFNEACDTQPSRCAGTVVAGPQQTWWVSVRNAKDQIGWTHQPERFERTDRSANKGDIGDSLGS
jgi:hypothetical protein